MAQGETVKYIIDADTSGFTRGMSQIAIESEVAGRAINKNLSGSSKKAESDLKGVNTSAKSTSSSLNSLGKEARGTSATIENATKNTAKHTENNFSDIRKNASKVANQIRSFSTALQGFKMTSIIIGITALSGATLELGGAFVAAGSSTSALYPALLQGSAAAATLKTGMFGLSDAMKAIAANDPKAFRESFTKLGPAAQQVAYGVAGLNKAFNSIRLNTQQALLAGVGHELLLLGSSILPTVNAGFQIVGRSLNSVFMSLASTLSQSSFGSLLSTIFADTARNVSILSGALSPLISIFTNLYLVTRNYTTLLAQTIVNLIRSYAAYIGSARGQAALNIAIQEGIVAIRLLGSLVGAVFGFLTAVFRTSVNSGNNLIATLTGIVQGMVDWVNSAKGQQDLISLFAVTSLVIKRVADDIGILLNGFFGILNFINNLNPATQKLVVNFLALALALEPIGGYFHKLYLSIKTVAVTLFNLGQEALGMLAVMGIATAGVLLLAGGLIILGAIIQGPLGSAFIIIGGFIAAYIGLSLLLARVSQGVAATFWEEAFAAYEAEAAETSLAATQGILALTMLEVGIAGLEAGSGLGFAATAAEFLQAALLPLLLLAAGVLIILSMLGVFSSRAQAAQTSSVGLGNSFSSLQASMKNVATTGKAANKGLAPLTDSLNNVGDAAAGAQGQLASFDKMNVLTPTVGGPGMGIPNIPSLPGIGGLNGGGVVAPAFDTAAFDKSLSDMQKNFNDVQKQISKPISNPFDSIGKFINSHPLPFFIAFAAILGIIIALFVTGAVAIGVATLPLTLIVIGVIALIAIIVLLVQNWSTVWATIQNIIAVTASFITNVFNGVISFFKTWGPTILALLFLPFSLLLGLLLTYKDQIVGFFQAIFEAIKVVILGYINIYVSIFSFLWESVKLIFTPVVGFFSNIFSGAWNAVKAAFVGAPGFFQGIWNTIVGIFGSIGVTIGNAIGGAFKLVINTIIDTVSGIVNSVIDLINGAISLINNIPGVHIGTLGRLTLPHLAKGGIVSQSTIANIGENGTEAIMPLENNTEWIDKLAAKISTSKDNGSNDAHIASRLDDKQPANNYTIKVEGVFATSVAEQRKIADLIAKRIQESTGYKTKGAF